MKKVRKGDTSLRWTYSSQDECNSGNSHLGEIVSEFDAFVSAVHEPHAICHGLDGLGAIETLALVKEAAVGVVDSLNSWMSELEKWKQDHSPRMHIQTSLWDLQQDFGSPWWFSCDGRSQNHNGSRQWDELWFSSHHGDDYPAWTAINESEIC